jgi:AcrR family transcriptional regulator
MVEVAGRRLSKEARRAQLLAIGRELAEASSLDELSTDEVAAVAGISRSLVFHYFPTREHFLLAIAQQASDELIAVTDPDPSLPPLERLRSALSAYIRYVVERRATYVALIRGQVGGDAEMQELFDRTRQHLADRMLTGLGVEPSTADPVLRLAARGYVALTEEVVVGWLQDGEDGAHAALHEPRLLDLLEQAAAGVLIAAGVPADVLDG